MTELSIIDRLERLMHDLRLEYQEYIELREIRYEVERLQAENAALKGRLSNSIELPCPLGVQMYVNFPFVGGERTIDGVFDGVKIGFDSDGTKKLCAIMRVRASSVYDDEYEEGEGETYLYYRLDCFNKTWWIKKKDALAKLEKPKGEKR